MRKYFQLLVSAVFAFGMQGAAAQGTGKISGGAEGTVPSAPALPKEVSVYLYPENISPRRGHQVKITSITGTPAALQAKIAMHGRGQDGCRIRYHDGVGSYVNGTLTVKPVIAAGDNITCPMEVTVVPQQGRWDNVSGSFKNNAYHGVVKSQ